MTKPIARDPIYRRRGFDAEIIELRVRWHITCRLAYRENASIALSGIELAYRIRERLCSFGRGRPPRRSTRAMWAMAMR